MFLEEQLKSGSITKKYQYFTMLTDIYLMIFYSHITLHKVVYFNYFYHCDIAEKVLPTRATKFKRPFCTPNDNIKNEAVHTHKHI